MPDHLRTWDKYSNSAWPTLLVGNGMSINVWRNFSYTRLLVKANLSQPARKLFDDFGTVNFEVVLEALWHAERTLAALGRPTAMVKGLYRHVQQQLVAAVRQVHVPWELLPGEALSQTSDELRTFQSVFTLNYDLLTYWAFMAGGHTADFGDFFWSHNNTFSQADCELSPARTGLYFLHGGVHLWQDSATGYTGKWTRRSVGRLLADLASALENAPNRRPLFVSEGTSAQKMSAIRRSDYLSFARRQLFEDHSDTVIFGASFGDQDDHVISALNAGPRRKFAISVRPGTGSQNVAVMARYRSRLPRHDLRFFDSRTHPLGDEALSVNDEN